MNLLRLPRTNVFGLIAAAPLVLVLVLALTPAGSVLASEALGAGDAVRITVFRNSDLDTETRISSDGSITFPLIGRVHLADRTVAEAGTVIADALRSGDFVRDAQVSVLVLEVRSRTVSILGHVARPGQYPLDGTNLTLTDGLALAGGITETGADTVIVMTERNGVVQRFEIDVPAMYRSGDLSGNIPLVSGDTLFVPNAPVFYVYGAVQRAGVYRLEPDTLVQHALSLGGGLTPRGSERGIRISRQMPDGTVERINARLSDPVQAGDVITIRESLF
jgi:polysaccharide biosynthesis/export protein